MFVNIQLPLLVHCLSPAIPLAVLSVFVTTSARAAESLKVGTKLFPPFVSAETLQFVSTETLQLDPADFEGYSIELWEQIASELEMEYTLTVYKSVKDMLEAVESGEVDAAIAGISITSEREMTLDFSYGYYESGLQILVLDHPRTPLQLIRAYIISWSTLRAIAIVLGMALASAHLLWLFERQANPDMFPKAYLPGIWEALWWSMVTATTVGYGDKSPKGIIGRVVAIAWMFSGIFVIAFFTASITANRLQTEINSLEDLYGKRVATVSDTTSAEHLQNRPLKLLKFNQVESTYQALETGQVQAVVYDAPTLLHRASQNPDFRVVGPLFAKQDYGIAFPEGSPLIEPINQILLRLNESGDMEALNQKWFPKSQ